MLVSEPDCPEDVAQALLDKAVAHDGWMQFIVYCDRGTNHYNLTKKGVGAGEFTSIQKAFREHLAATEAHRVASPDNGGGGGGGSKDDEESSPSVASGGGQPSRPTDSSSNGKAGGNTSNPKRKSRKPDDA